MNWPAEDHQAANLRRSAEARLKGEPRGDAPEADTVRLVHELQVHQIELEIQNEELRQARVETQAALDRYTDLYDFAPVGHFTLDGTGFIRQLNRSGAELLGGDHAQLAGKRFRDFVDENDRYTLSDFLARVYGSSRISCEILLRSPGSSRQPLPVRVEAVMDSAGKHTLLAVIDITASKEAELALQASEARHRLARAAADRANLAKSHFLANTGHELRTPLTRLIIIAQLLANNLEGNLTAQQVEYALMISEGGSDLRYLIDDLLDLASIEAGTLEVELKAVAFPDLLQEVQRIYQRLAKQKGLIFGIEIDADVPPTLTTDPLRLQQLLRSLLGNAIKFTLEGGITLRVRRVAGGAGIAVAFDVIDTGIGITAEHQRSIFELFRAGSEGVDHTLDGAGLGLPIARQIAALLGGDLTLASTPGQGSTFSLHLPLVATPAL